MTKNKEENNEVMQLLVKLFMKSLYGGSFTERFFKKLPM